MPDAYFPPISRIRERVCFVTTDNVHILSDRDRIEELLPGITVRRFLPVNEDDR